MTCFHDSVFRKTLLALVLLAALGSGCEEKVLPPPYPGSYPAACPPRTAYSSPEARRPQAAQPIPGAYSPQVTGTGGPAEVVEKSVAYLGSPRTIYHEIGPLETIWRISRMYGVTTESIYSANRLSPGDPLQVGQKLVIPNARTIRHVVNLYRNPRWKYIIVHHTATGKGNAKTINRSHSARGFWNGLGYHFLIDNGTFGKGDGQIEMSPRWVRQQCGAHCKADGMNDKAIGICLVGNFDYEKPTPNQLRSLAFLLSVLRNYYRIPSSNVMGHRDVPGAKTRCPGKFFPVNCLR